MCSARAGRFFDLFRGGHEAQMQGFTVLGIWLTGWALFKCDVISDNECGEGLEYSQEYKTARRVAAAWEIALHNHRSRLPDTEEEGSYQRNAFHQLPIYCSK